MKKFWVAFPAMIIAFVLSSCESEVHWGKYSTYVPWYVVWVPVTVFVTVVSVIAHICIISAKQVGIIFGTHISATRGCARFALP